MRQAIQELQPQGAKPGQAGLLWPVFLSALMTLGSLLGVYQTFGEHTPGMLAPVLAGLVALLRARACSYAAVLGAQTLTIYVGIVFPVRRVVPRRAVTGIQQLRSPLLRLAGVTVLVISAPGARVLVPAVPAAQAAALAYALAEDAPCR